MKDFNDLKEKIPFGSKIPDRIVINIPVRLIIKAAKKISKSIRNLAMIISRRI